MKFPNIRNVLIVVTFIFAGALWQIVTLILDNPHITNYPPKGTHIIVLGGSLTVGVGASNQEHGYISILSERLSVPITNKGVSGNTTVDALLRLDSDVLQEKPDIVIVFLGGNDYLKKISPPETRANLRLIITKIQSQGATVLLLGYTARFDNYLNDLAKKTGALYVPNVLEGIVGNATLMNSDGIHPNDAGYLKIADKIAPDLLGLISGVPSVPTHE